VSRWPSDACPFQGVQNTHSSPDDVYKRASNFQRFVHVAEVLQCSRKFVCGSHYILPFQECRKVQNFSSMSAIITELKSATRAHSTTSQLVLTRESKLSRSEKQLLYQLEEIVDPIRGHHSYREAWQNIKSPFVIPWLGACVPHVNDLTPYDF
jgi:hypothetical protein